MENFEKPAGCPRSGLDTVIKLLTIVKLLIEVAFWGLFLGLSIWFIYHNPIPQMMEDMTGAMTKTLSAQGAAAVPDSLQGLLNQLPNLKR